MSRSIESKLVVVGFVNSLTVLSLLFTLHSSPRGGELLPLTGWYPLGSLIIKVFHFIQTSFVLFFFIVLLVICRVDSLDDSYTGGFQSTVSLLILYRFPLYKLHCSFLIHVKQFKSALSQFQPFFFFEFIDAPEQSPGTLHLVQG